MSEKKEIYLVNAEFRGIRMNFDAFEDQNEAIEAAKAIDKATASETARIAPINLYAKIDSKELLEKALKIYQRRYLIFEDANQYHRELLQFGRYLKSFDLSDVNVMADEKTPSEPEA